jgi:endonuclease/exonuclease/phosphatase (EEP) superfamily protein YafD
MPSVRVATYNVYLGADLSALFAVTGPDELADQVKVIRSQLDATHAGERARAIAGLLARERPHLVGLQEVARWTVAPLDEDGVAGPEQTFVDFRHELLGALAAAGCAYDACAVNENFAGALPVSERELFGVRVDGVPVRFLNTHTEAYDPAVRDAQCKELLDLQCEVDAPVILVGDLNARPEAVGVSDPWADAWTQGRGTGFTCGQSADLANVHSALAERIDYVWVRGARVLRCAVVGDRPADRTDPHRLWPSDHAGVVADLHLADSR